MASNEELGELLLIAPRFDEAIVKLMIVLNSILDKYVCLAALFLSFFSFRPSDKSSAYTKGIIELHICSCHRSPSKLLAQ